MKRSKTNVGHSIARCRYRREKAPSPIKPIYAFILLIFSVFLKTGVYTIHPPVSLQTVISGQGWAYTVPFPVKNAHVIEKLISCESGGVDGGCGIDSNGKESCGILQYQDATWSDFSSMSGISGSPLIPQDAIKMTDWAISHGFLYRWTCARILGLVPTKTAITHE